MDSEKATFYNNEEDWEFQTPIAPLLKNEVFAAMLSGQFKESNTKRICLPGFSKSVVQQFISDLTKYEIGEQIFNQYDDGTLFNIKLTRLAHQLNQNNLIAAYMWNITQTCRSYAPLTNIVVYELVKLVFDLSLTSIQYDVMYKCKRQLNVMFELDDHVLLKSIRHSGNPGMWISMAIQHNAFKCLTVLLTETPVQKEEAKQILQATTSATPDELLTLVITKHTTSIDYLLHGGGAQLGTATLGALLRAVPDSFDTWHNVFEMGYMEIVKFAPKSLLVQNNAQKSFGMTAITKGWINCVELILSEGWDPRPTKALFAALGHVDPKLIQLLLSHGAVPNVETVRLITDLRQNRAACFEVSTCLHLIEQATLANAFESDIYKAYASKPAEDNS